jgi:hypothetical protein
MPEMETVVVIGHNISAVSALTPRAFSIEDA